MQRKRINDVKQITQKLFEAGKTIDYVSHTLHILRSSVGSFKKRNEQRDSIENICRRGNIPAVTSMDNRKLERLVKVHR